MPGYSYLTAPDGLRTYVDDFSRDARNCALTEITSVILYGSLAMGSFYPPKSDVDILIVAEDLSERQSQSLYKLSERYHQARPFAG
ncbi:nucleotidyltransferase domain-containing protein, partial [Vineibacter terrae]|uniref:nucleotidyltransferase domain-containing protein n=1 Tax=Vineibacter terrae TaxID=2586908 RepID=UPI0039C967DD